jgi:hypothetical protein
MEELKKRLMALETLISYFEEEKKKIQDEMRRMEIDAFWAKQADEAKKDGFLSEKESEDLISSLLDKKETTTTDCT